MSNARFHHLLSTLTIFSIIIVIASGACPYKLCQCEGTSIFCFGNGYTTLPTINDTGNEFTEMSIGMFNLKEIPDNSLPSNIQHMEIFATPLLTVGSHAFDRIGKTLQHLEVANVRFTKIPDAFSALKNLTYFEIRDSNILDWNENALKNIGLTLTTFQSANVSFKSFPSWMKYFTALQSIQIFSDPITYFPDDSFEGFKDSLTDMSISKVNISQTPKAFTALRQIEFLHLANNNITEVKFVPQSTTIKSLVLSQNLIASSPSLTQNLLPLRKSLDFLDLSFNNLTELPDFTGMATLKFLELNDNQIKDSNKPFLPSTITSLDLANNKLTKIPSLHSVDNLESLYLSINFISELNGQDIPATLQSLWMNMNKVTSLQESSFPVNSSMTVLDLSMNFLNTISDHAFKNLGKLQSLFLQAVNLTRLPMALADLKYLQILELSDNDYLVCTCKEAGLLPWFKSLPNISIDGKCGNMTITYFFEKVAPNCHTLN